MQTRPNSIFVYSLPKHAKKQPIILLGRVYISRYPIPIRLDRIDIESIKNHPDSETRLLQHFFRLGG